MTILPSSRKTKTHVRARACIIGQNLISTTANKVDVDRASKRARFPLEINQRFDSINGGKRLSHNTETKLDRT